MARDKRSPLLLAAKPTARPLPLRKKVKITDAAGSQFTGLVTQKLSLEAGHDVVILHLDQQHIGEVEFAEDFDHVHIKGLPDTYLIKEITLIEILDE